MGHWAQLLWRHPPQTTFFNHPSMYETQWGPADGDRRGQGHPGIGTQQCFSQLYGFQALNYNRGFRDKVSERMNDGSR